MKYISVERKYMMLASSEPIAAEDTVSIELDVKEGILEIGEAFFRVKDFFASVPSHAFREGENILLLTKKGERTKTVLEPIVKQGNVLCPREFDARECIVMLAEIYKKNAAACVKNADDIEKIKERIEGYNVF